MRSEFSQLVKRTREKVGISQETLASVAGVAPSYVAMIESGLRGRLPGAEVVVKLARALDASPAEFMEAAGRTLTVIEAIRADPILTEREKASLVDHYRSYLEG